jgi:hypothetical protein
MKAGPTRLVSLFAFVGALMGGCLMLQIILSLVNLYESVVQLPLARAALEVQSLQDDILNPKSVKSL